MQDVTHDPEHEAAVYKSAQQIGREVEVLVERIASNRRRWAADEAAERQTEGRRFKALEKLAARHE